MSSDQRDRDRAKEMLSAYVDGDLPADKQRELEALLEQDAALREDLQSLEVMLQSLRELRDTAVPEQFAQRAERRWRLSRRHTDGARSWPILAFASLAMILILVLLTVYLFQIWGGG